MMNTNIITLHYKSDVVDTLRETISNPLEGYNRDDILH